MERESNGTGDATLQINYGKLNMQIKVLSDSIASYLTRSDF